MMYTNIIAGCRVLEEDRMLYGLETSGQTIDLSESTIF